jgi:hypothetical protein
VICCWLKFICIKIVSYPGPCKLNNPRHTKMRLAHWIVFCQLFLLPGAAAAETIDLTCVHREYRMKLNFTIDTVKNTVVENSVLAREVNIDKTTISFVIDLTSGEYFHYITRSSGNMTVKAPDGTLIHGYECDTAKGKF